MIVGLVSAYKDGRLAADAAASLLSCCISVQVTEGPIGEGGEGISTDWRPLLKTGKLIVRQGAWASDAAKRTDMLQGTRRLPTPTWGVIVDSDEALIFGEHLPALIEYREQQCTQAGAEPLNVPLRLVEQDGSVGFITARVLRLDRVERWLISSYHLQLRSGAEVSLGNVYPLATGEPDRREKDDVTGLQIRRPLYGEPHLLHRSFFRPPQRDVERQSKAEGTEFEKLVRDAGLLDAHGEKVKDERSAIWLPQ